MRRFAGIAVVAIVTIAFVVPAPFATLWPDTVRDASASLALARGEAFPLAGPSINFGPSLGPAWIWVQSVPFLFGASLAAASVYVAVLASLKFGFYYGLGRTLSGERLGVCLAVAAALPSIAVFQWVVFFHPDVVESAIAAALFVGAVALKRKSVALVYLSAAVLGIAVQFHPTALFYYPLVLFALLRTVDRKSRLVLHAAGTVLMIAVWFAPTVTADIGQRAGLESVAAGIAASLRSFRLSDVATGWA